MILLIPLLLVLMTCMSSLGTGSSSDNSGGTTDETVVRTGAIIYEQDGITPAEGATVKVFKVDALDRQIVCLQTTNNEGRFVLDDLEPGIFNIWVEKDSMVAFQDSVCISALDRSPKNDTLDCASSLTGITVLQPLYDPRSISVQVVGTDKISDSIDSTGHFILRGLAGGRYSLLLKSALPDYISAIQKVHVHDCTNDTLKDTIRIIDNNTGSLICALHTSPESISINNYSTMDMKKTGCVYTGVCTPSGTLQRSDLAVDYDSFSYTIRTQQHFP